MLGEYGVGKSALSMRIAQDLFDDDPDCIIAKSFEMKINQYKLNPDGESKNYKVTIPDTRGQEKLTSSMPKMYYRDS